MGLLIVFTPPPSSQKNNFTCAPYARMVGRPLREDEMWAYTGDLRIVLMEWKDVEWRVGGMIIILPFAPPIPYFNLPHRTS